MTSFLIGTLLISQQMKWKPNDESRPVPPIISVRGGVPSDAVVLLNGRDLSNWESVKGGPAKWKVGKGYVEIAPKTGDIRTKKKFGDCQLHIEWRTPSVVSGDGQKRGNSGVWLMGLYEVQVLDSFKNRTYADGQAGSIYAQYPPLVNSSRGPGEWQSYDIIFHRPRWKGQKLASPARMTVFHNGVLIQDNVSLTGPSAFQSRPPYTKTADRLPLMLQDHGNPVRFRNLWVRDLE